MMDVTCPVPHEARDLITLAHGAGGKAMHDLIRDEIAALYGAGFAPDHDGARLPIPGPVAFTTDSFVVSPLVFPGGDIGKLAVFGTVNDLAMCGAKPLYLSCSFIIEEGLDRATLRGVCRSMAAAAREAGVAIVTGDTKVVGRGQADGLYVNTAGIGLLPPGPPIHPRQARPGDRIVVSGDVGRHGMAIVAAREGITGEGILPSDCAPLGAAVQALLDAGLRPRCLRDLTRGGLAAALHEIAEVAGLGLVIEESAVPVDPGVRGPCEILGFDPWHMANEGRFLAIVPPEEAEAMLALLRAQAGCGTAAVCGHVAESAGVEVVGPYGTRRLLPRLQGEPLPRIC